jgi:hypothetical protein
MIVRIRDREVLFTKKKSGVPMGMETPQNGFPICYTAFERLESGLLGVPVRVDRRKVRPFLRQVFESEDGRHGADGNACATVDALDRADVQLRLRLESGLVFPGMDAIHRANVHTSGVLGSYTGLSNYIRHRDSPSRGVWNLKSCPKLLSKAN